MTKKVIRLLTVKWKFFPKKGQSKIWSAKFVFRPANSAPLELELTALIESLKLQVKEYFLKA